jgi:hypothetical protein
MHPSIDTDDSDKIEGATDGAAQETTESWVPRLRVLTMADASSASATTLNTLDRGARAAVTPGWHTSSAVQRLLFTV